MGLLSADNKTSTYEVEFESDVSSGAVVSLSGQGFPSWTRGYLPAGLNTMYPVGSVVGVRSTGTTYLIRPGTGGLCAVLAGQPWAQVLASGNVSGPNSALLDAGQRLDTSTATRLDLGTVSATDVAIGSGLGTPGTLRVFINQGGTALEGSNTGIQYASTFANRAQIRVNAYGNHTGVAGITGYKSRGLNVGDRAPVQVGDAIFRATAIGVTGPAPGYQIPLSGLLTFYVEGVYASHISTLFEIELNPPEGPTNGRVPMFAITPNGVPCLREQPNRAAGVAVLDAAGQAVIANTAVDANSRFTLTVQDGGPPPSGVVYQSARTVGTNFTIRSSAGAADAGVVVYWQIWGQTALGRPF